MKILSKALLIHSGLYLFKTPGAADSYTFVITNLDPWGRSSLDHVPEWHLHFFLWKIT